MINFRYHVVSILAVFLALAIGTVMGASFVGRGLIDNLQKQVTQVRHNADDQNAENDKLTSEADKLNAYVNQTAPFAVARSLTGIRVNLVAERGVDGGVVDAQATLLRQGAGTVPGVIWLEDRWKLESADDASALRSATGLTNKARPALRTAAARLLGERLGAFDSGAVTVPTVPVSPTDDVLIKLAAAKFVTLSGVAGGATPVATDFVTASSRVLELGGPGHAVPADVVPAVAGGVVSGGGSAAVGQVFVDPDSTLDRGAWIDAVANLDGLRGKISTVDDVESVEGQVGTTLALSELGLGGVGNYGVGRERAVPEKASTVPSAR